MEVWRQIPLKPLRRVEDVRSDGLGYRGWVRNVGALIAGLAELAQLAGAHRLDDRVVGVEQPQGHPPAVRQPGKRVLHDLRERRHRGLDRGRVTLDSVRCRRRLAGRDTVRGVEQFVDPDLGARDATDDRNPQLLLKAVRVDGDAVPPGLVHQVQEDHHAVGDVEDLEDKVEVPLETGGVDHHYGDIGTPEENEVARDLLVHTARLERVGAGKVHHLHPLALMGKGAFSPHDGLPGPVAGVLPETGEGVEDRALADVGVAGQRDEIVPLVRTQPEPDQTLRAMLGAPTARRCRQDRHQATSLTPRSLARVTRIHAACVRRRAMSAPRMR